ncbi:hypothetical protein Golob_003928, partial [Gossypium lobatum]|nr:hypothetical protein [Gossypium lobatum]
MGACVYPVNNIRDSTTVEVVVCLQAVTFTEEMGFDDVVIEGDSLTIIKKLNIRKRIVCLPPVRLKIAVAVRLITVAVRLNNVAVRLETMVECVFGFKSSCSSE